MCLPKTSRPKQGQTFVHVNSHVIRGNKKHGTNDPPVVIRRRGGDKTLVHEAEIRIDGKTVAKIVYRKEQPLECGAVVWIETEGEVVPVA